MDDKTPSEIRKLKDLVNAARQDGRARDERLGHWNYLRFTRNYQSIPAGTIAVGDTVIFGYPKIGRMFHLGQGLDANFACPFWVEEKVDGYNVRIFAHENEVLAVTRRGYICPFTTDRIKDFININLFTLHPNLIVCAEVAGPENPYNTAGPPYISEDIRFFVFDLMRKNHPGFLTHLEKDRLLTKFALPRVTEYGQFRLEEHKRLENIISILDYMGREGIVMKEDSPRDLRVKYVTGRSNIDDIESSNTSFRQLPADYFIHRLFRLGLYLDEHGIERTPSLYHELGKSLIEGVVSTAKQYHHSGKITQHFRCRFRNRHNAELLMKSLSRSLGKGNLQQHQLEPIEGYYILEFDKTLPKTTGLLSHALRGGITFD